MIQALLQGIKTIYNITDNLKKKKKTRLNQQKPSLNPLVTVQMLLRRWGVGMGIDVNLAILILIVITHQFNSLSIVIWFSFASL